MNVFFSLSLAMVAPEGREVLVNRLIPFAADYGDQMGDHLLERKTIPYESSVHYPLSLRPPDPVEIT